MNLSTQDLIGNDGELPTITHAGKVYKVSYCSPVVVAKIESVVLAELMTARRELEAAAMASPELSAEFGRQIQEISQSIASREYAFGRKYYQSITSQPGKEYLRLWACIVVNHPEITLADMVDIVENQLDQVAAVMEMIDPDFFTLLVANMGLNKEQAQAMKKILETNQQRLRAFRATSTPTVTCSTNPGA